MNHDIKLDHLNVQTFSMNVAKCSLGWSEAKYFPWQEQGKCPIFERLTKYFSFSKVKKNAISYQNHSIVLIPSKCSLPKQAVFPFGMSATKCSHLAWMQQGTRVWAIDSIAEECLLIANSYHYAYCFLSANSLKKLYFLTWQSQFPIISWTFVRNCYRPLQWRGGILNRRNLSESTVILTDFFINFPTKSLLTTNILNLISPNSITHSVNILNWTMKFGQFHIPFVQKPNSSTNFTVEGIIGA